MRAEAERDVLVRAALDVEAVRVVELRLVAVGRLVEQHALLALVQLLAHELGVVRDRAAHVLDRADPAQHLLDRDRDLAPDRRRGSLPLVGVQQQLLHAAADDVAGGLVAADEDQQRLVQDVVGRRGGRRRPRRARARSSGRRSGRPGAARPRACRTSVYSVHGVHRADELLLGRAAALRARPCRRTSAAGRRGPRARRRACRRSGPSAAARRCRATKSHSPRSQTGSMIASHDCRGSRPRCRAPGCGVKPRFTSLRRFQCSGSSMSIIIGIGPLSGRMPPAFENVVGSFDVAEHRGVATRCPTRRCASSKYTGALSRIHVYVGCGSPP